MLLSVRGVGDAFCVEPPLKLNSYSSMGGSGWERSGASAPVGLCLLCALCFTPQTLCLSFQASSPAYSGSNLYSPDSSANSGPIISDVTELAQSSPSASPSGSLDER